VCSAEVNVGRGDVLLTDDCGCGAAVRRVVVIDGGGWSGRWAGTCGTVRRAAELVVDWRPRQLEAPGSQHVVEATGCAAFALAEPSATWCEVTGAPR